MSYENRQEDLENILNLYIGEEYYFNMFHEGGCMTRRSEDGWELFEIPLYGGRCPQFFCSYAEDELEEMIDEGYSWT